MVWVWVTVRLRVRIRVRVSVRVMLFVEVCVWLEFDLLDGTFRRQLRLGALNILILQ